MRNLIVFFSVVSLLMTPALGGPAHLDHDVVKTFNCDTICCFEHSYASWFAVGLRNDPGTVWHMNLYSDTLCRSGLLERTHGTDRIDYIVGDCNHSRTGWYGLELYRESGTGAVSVEFEGTAGTWLPPRNTWRWDPGDIIESFDHERTAGETNGYGTWFEDLDVGLSIHCSVNGTETYQARDEAELRGGALKDDGGAGVPEHFTWTAPSTDCYGVFVWVNNAVNDTMRGYAAVAEDAGQSGPGNDILRFGGSPSVFRHGTQLEFVLPQAARTTLEIWDVTGRCIRTLEQGLVSAGRHRICWSGLDSKGNTVPPGWYLSRLTTEDGSATTLLLKLE